MKHMLTFLVLCLCVAGCATLNDVGKHLWNTDSQEGQSADKKVEPTVPPEVVPDNLIADPIVEKAKESEPKLFPDQSGPLRELLIQSWNLAYNTSPKYPDAKTRWKYVYAAVKLLRDEGIKRYPKEPLVYDQLAYLFEHKSWSQP